MITLTRPVYWWPQPLVRSATAITITAIAGGCAATGHHTTREPPRSTAEHTLPAISRDVVTFPAERITDATSPSELATYLESVALALASPEASVRSVLQAARAREVEASAARTRFRAPDPRVTGAFVRLPEAETGPDSNPRPQSVTFRFDAHGAPVTLPELATVFGPWTDEVPTVTLADPYQVAFTVPLPASDIQRRRRGPLTFVSLSLSDAPSRSDARVRQVLFRRFSIDP